MSADYRIQNDSRIIFFYVFNRSPFVFFIEKLTYKVRRIFFKNSKESKKKNECC